MKRLLLPSLALLALAGCRPNSAAAGLYPTTTAIGGFVSNAADGAPISGAAVILSASGQPDLTATTDIAGIYQVASQVQADALYTVKVAAPGYSANQITVQTSLNLVAQADVLLAPEVPTLDASPTTIDLGEETATASLMIANSASSGTLEWVVVSPTAWVTASPDSGQIAAGGPSTAVTLTANRAALGTDYGPHSAFVALSSNGGLQYVAVRIDYPNPSAPQLAYDVTSLDFALDKQSLPVAIRNTGTGTLTWTAPTNIPWITCQPAAGSVAAGQSQSVTVKIDRAQLLAASDYDVFIAFDSNTTIELASPVRVHASTPHVVAWETSPASIDLGRRSFGSEIVLKNTGTDSLEWTATAPVPWLKLVPSSGHIGAGATARLQVQLDRASVPLGPFSQSVHLHSEASDVTIPVTGNRQYVAILNASSTVAAAARGERSVTASLFVNNAGETQSQMDWAITTTAPWLSFTPASSTAAGNTLAGNETFCTSVEDGCGAAVTARIDLSAIATAGTTTGIATVRSVATGESQDIFFSVIVAPFHWPGTTFSLPTELQVQDPGALAYDTINDRLLLVQQTYVDGTATVATTTWAFKNGTWAKLTTAHAPNSFGRLLFDRRRGVAVYLPFRYQNGDLWEFDGADWIHPSVSRVMPSSAVFDPATGKILALVADGAAYDVFTYDGVWREVNHGGVPGTTGLAQGAENAFLLAGTNDSWVTLLNVQNPPYYVAIGGLSRNASGDWKPAERPLFAGAQDTLVVDQKSDDLYLLGQSFAANPALLRVNAATNTREVHALPAGVTPRYQAGAAYDFAQDRIVYVGGYCGNGSDLCTDNQIALALHAPGAPARSPALTVPGTAIAFGTARESATLTVTNSGPYVVPFSALPPAGYAASPEWADVKPNSSVTITLTVNRAALGAGPHSSTWSIRSLGQTTAITVTATNP